MNSSSPSDNTHESARLETMREQINTDLESVRRKETSLQEYEQKLHRLVEQASQYQPAARMQVAGQSQADLDSAWEKYERAYALLEAARRSLCEDRMVIKERDQQISQRESDVSRREAWVKIREQELEAQAGKVEVKARPTFTTAPFLAARNLLSMGKSH